MVYLASFMLRVFTGVLSIPFNTSVVTSVTGLTFLQQIRPNFRAITSSIVMAVAVTVVGAMLPPSFDVLKNLEKILILVPLGVFAYIGCTVLHWTLAGRPKGPETDLISLLTKAIKFPWKVSAIADKG